MKRKKGNLSVFLYKLPNVVRISLYSCGKRIESYRKIPKISPSKYKPPKLVTQETLS